MYLLQFHIQKGEEMMSFLDREFKARNLLNGVIVSVIGAVDEAAISNMPEKDAMKDILTQYKKPMELSGNGEIRDGKAHIHCTLSSEGDKAVHGHLHSAKVVNWYVNVFVIAD